MTYNRLPSVLTVDATPATRRAVECFGFIDEWHLDFGNAFRHFAFEFLPWFCQPREMIATAFFRARFEAIGSVRHLVGCDGS